MSDDARISETLHLHHNIGTVLRDFSVDDRPIIRRLEGLLKKHNNARYAVIFTETCIKENLLPKFTYIKLSVYEGPRLHEGKKHGYDISALRISEMFDAS